MSEMLKNQDFRMSFGNVTVPEFARQAFRPETRGTKPNVNPAVVVRSAEFAWEETVRPDLGVFRPEVSAMKKRRVERLNTPLRTTKSQG